MTNDAGTALERQIRSQPEAIEHMLSSPAVRQQVHLATEGLHRARRLWVVGTGTSLHAAELGAAMLMEAGRAATVVPAMQFVTTAPVIGPKDGVIVITHTGETSYALAARALAFTGGLDTVTITKRGTDFPRAIETVDAETSETYTVSYTSALIALALIAQELGAESLSHDALAAVPDAVRAAIDDPGVASIPRPAARARAHGRGARGHHRSRGSAEGPGGGARARRGLRRRVPAARLGRAARQPRPPRDARPARRAADGGRRRRGGHRGRRPHLAAGAGDDARRCSPRSRSPCACRCWPCAWRRKAATTPTRSSWAPGPTRPCGARAPRRSSQPPRQRARSRQPVRRSCCTNARTAASSRSPTRACTRVPASSWVVESTSDSR